jgi:hypothetical protein
MVVVLDSPSIAASKIGRLVVGVLIKCEFMVPYLLLKTPLAFMFSSGHRYSNALLSLFAAILAFHFMVEVSPEENS